MQDDFDNELNDRATWIDYLANYFMVPASLDDDTSSAVGFSRLEHGEGDGRSMMSTNFGDFDYDISVAIPKDNAQPRPWSLVANAGAVFRGKNPLISGYSSPQDGFGGYYAGILVESKVILSFAKNGTWNELMSANMGEAFNVGEWNLLRVTAKWNSIKVFVGRGGDVDTPVITVEDDIYLVGQSGPDA